jgi:hypothetical protein
MLAKVLYEAGFVHASVQQFVERLNDLNRYLLYFLEEKPNQLDHNEIIEILDQAILWDPDWHEAMVLFQAFGELGEDQAYQRSLSFLTTSRK